MSTIRDPAVITNAGRQMMTAGGDISYTKAVLYGQDISHLTKDQLESLTSIGNPLLTVPVGISDKNNAGANTTVVLEATFQNTDLKADLPYTAVGFFAKRGDDAEKLVIVGVANSGAYLAATSPDGVASDALDVKVAIAIGDATSVTAVVDPAGSVTPATLNGAINKATHDLTAKIDTKADKTDVTAQFATKADKTTVEQELAVKANSADVDKELTTKANASDVYTKSQTDGKLGQKITFVKCDSPQAAYEASTKPAADGSIVFGIYDMNDEPSEAYVAGQKINIEWLYNHLTDLQSTVNSELATKADASDVADKIKSLQDSINVKANETVVDSKIIGVTNKLKNYTNTTDLNELLASKADTDYSYSKAELDKKLLALSTGADGKVGADQVAQMIANKADKNDVTNQIKSVTNLVNAVQANYSKRPVYSGSANDDLLAFKTTQLRYYSGNGDTCKNVPPAQNKRWYTVEYIFENPNGDGVAIYRSPASEIWINGNNGGDYGNWLRIADANDINSLQARITDVKNMVTQASQIANAAQSTADTKASQADLDKTNAKVATKANSSDVADKVKSLQDSISTKADKATVDSEISKIDFTPYAKTTDVNAELAGKANKTDIYTKAQVDTALAGRDSSISNATHLAEQAQATADRKDDVSDVDKKVKSVSDKLATKANSDDVYTKADTDNKLGKKISFEICDSPQAAYEASTKPAADGSIVFGIYDMNNEPSEAYVAGQKINIEWLYNHLTDLQSTVNNGLATKANQSDLDTTNATVESQATEIASLKAQLNDAVNQINYIKANYIEGKRFAKSDEAQANSWENANPQRIAFITDD